MGRGTGSVDEEGRQFIVSSISMKIWHVKEYSYQLLSEEEYGHFFSSEGMSSAVRLNFLHLMPSLSFLLI